MVDEVVEVVAVQEVGVHFSVTSGNGNDSSCDAAIRVQGMDEARAGSSLSYGLEDLPILELAFAFTHELLVAL